MVRATRPRLVPKIQSKLDRYLGKGVLTVNEVVAVKRCEATLYQVDSSNEEIDLREESDPVTMEILYHNSEPPMVLVNKTRGLRIKLELPDCLVNVSSWKIFANSIGAESIYVRCCDKHSDEEIRRKFRELNYSSHGAMITVTDFDVTEMDQWKLSQVPARSGCLKKLAIQGGIDSHGFRVLNKATLKELTLSNAGDYTPTIDYAVLERLTLRSAGKVNFSKPLFQKLTHLSIESSTSSVRTSRLPKLKMLELIEWTAATIDSKVRVLKITATTKVGNSKGKLTIRVQPEYIIYNGLKLHTELN